MRNQHGYIALTSIIIVSLLLLTITAVLSTTNYFSRYNILENEYKSRSSSLAEACVDFALAKLIANNSYTGNETATIGSDTCLVNSVTSGNFPKTISTTGMYPQTGAKKSYTNLSIRVDANMNTLYWRECLTTSTCP